MRLRALVSAVVVLMSVAVGALVSCKTRTAEEPSDVKFVPGAWNVNSCTISKALEPEIRVCVKRTAASTEMQKKIEGALMKWINPLRTKYEGVTQTIKMSCNAPHLNVDLQNGYATCFASPGNITCGTSNQLGTWIHEFGHAFACLGDTYVGRTAGACQQGQPKSIMCYGMLLSELTKDDIDGLHHQFQRLAIQKTPIDPTGDEDGDGVANNVDKCPFTAAGATIWKDQENGKWRGCATGQTPHLL